MNYYLVFLIVGVVLLLVFAGISVYLDRRPNNDGDLGLGVLALIAFVLGAVILVLDLLAFLATHVRVGWI